MANKTKAEFTQRIVTPIEPDVKAELTHLAYMERKPITEIVRKLIDGYIKRTAPKYK